jgi:epoxide hydrolase 4
MAEQQGQGDWVSGVREGYAEVGDQRLHYVEAGDGPLVVLLHGFPEFWYGWRRQIQPLAAAGFRVVAPDMRGYNLSSKPDGVKAYDTGPLVDDIRSLIRERGAESALLVGHDWGGTVAWDLAMNHPEVVDRLAILNAAHPRKLSQGLHHPGQLRKSWYFFFFRSPGPARKRRARRPMAFLSALPARRSPGLHAGGDRSLHRGMVAARRSNRDDQLLPVLGADLA